MIQLNLLPPLEKKEIVSHQARRKILGLGLIGLMLVLVFLVLLSTVWFYLLIQLRSMEGIITNLENSTQGQAARQYQKEVEDANKKLKSFSQLSSAVKEFSPWLEHLTALPRSGVKFEQLSFDGKEIKLQGHAQARDNLLTFKQALSASEYFQNLDAPLQNFLKQSDIDFSFSFRLKDNKISQ